MAAETPVNSPTPPPTDGNPTVGGEKPKGKSRVRRIAGTLGISFLTLLIVGAIGLGTAEYYTGRPQFCGSCHVMDPYYETWSRDLHGAKLGVKCIDCHYAPGERLTIKAKFKGLSQVASYFSGRYGSARPRAHVSDDSCLTAPCHGDRAFMTKKIEIGESRKETRIVDGKTTEIQRDPTVHFYHEKHLNIESKLADSERERDTLTARVRAAVPADVAESIMRLTSSVAPAEQRQIALVTAMDLAGVAKPVREDVTALLNVEHRHTRLKQLSGASCSTCHNFDPSGKNHLAVNKQNCFTCHFTNEGFNEGTGECLKCHEPPSRTIFVHGTENNPTSSPVLMDHRDIVARGVDCSSCHLDVVRGNSSVSIRECRHCHDSDKFLSEFATRTTKTVEAYHESHVAHQRARCDDCHQSVTHRLLDPLRETTAGFLEPVLSDCQHCHPGHHHEQVQMLSGVGGVGAGRDTPNAMLGSRLNCRACHVQSGEGAKGDAVVKATQKSCIACHSADYAQLFDQQRSELDGSIKEVRELLARVEQRVAARPGGLPSGAAEKIESARQNIHFVEMAGGMHNKHFAIQLLDAARRSLEEISDSFGPQQ